MSNRPANLTPNNDSGLIMKITLLKYYCIVINIFYLQNHSFCMSFFGEGGEGATNPEVANSYDAQTRYHAAKQLLFYSSLGF